MLPDMPKLMPLLLLNATVPEVAVCVPAPSAPKLPVAVAPEGIEPVTVDPLRPKLTLLRLEKTRLVALLLVVPAEKLTAEINPAVEGTV